MVTVTLHLSTKDIDTVGGISEIRDEKDFILLVSDGVLHRYNKNFVVSFTSEES